MKRARCAPPDIPTEIFFPVTGRATRMAEDVCDGCGVVSECLEYALLRRDTVGVWGGTSGRQRMVIRKERGLAPADTATLKEPKREQSSRK